MTGKTRDHKLKAEQAKANEEFKTRLISSQWQKCCPEQDAILRVEALLHFNPRLNDRQILSRAITNVTMACRPASRQECASR